MNILFDAFKYTDDYQQRLSAGIVKEEDDYDMEKDCYREKVLIETDDVSASGPIDGGKYTHIFAKGFAAIIDVPFNDFVRLVPHVNYAQAKSRWAN